MICFAEALEVDDLTFTKEADDVVDVGIVGETENVVIRETGFLLGGQIFGEVGNDVAGGLHGGCAPGVTGGKLGINPGGMIHKVGGEGSPGNVLFLDVTGELMDQRAHHLQMAQLIWTSKI